MACRAPAGMGGEWEVSCPRGVTEGEDRGSSPRGSGRPRLRPVLADVGLRVGLDPAIEQFGEPVWLRTAAREVSLEDDDQHEVSLTGEVGRVLGHDRPSLVSGTLRDLRVVGGPQPALGDMNRVPTELIPKELSGRRCEHLVDEQADHRDLPEERVPFLGCLPAPFEGGLVAFDQTLDLVAMRRRVVDRHADLPRMQIGLVGEDGDALLVAAGQLPQPGDHLPHVGPGREPGAAGRRWTAMDDARMVERVDAFDDQPLEELRRAGAVLFGPLRQTTTRPVADPIAR